MDSLMTTSELVQKKISNFFTSDHTKETPHHADDLACDFEGFNNDSHKLDYSSDATTVSFNTLKLEADDDCSDGCSTSELKQKKILDLEAVDDCSDGCSMDSLELAKLDEKVLAGYISNDDTKSLDCSDCSMDSLDKKVLDKKKMIKRVLEEAGYRRSDATTDSCESLYIID
ncbi:unnamed protein product [Meganyctiphanes norvegica]|uniref:Uncharacterized protein n=1 Tax=Meganyctiphanes norvegica TaxID=48144 RepID=A0AAV2PI34_MEGNR